EQALQQQQSRTVGDRQGLPPFAPRRELAFACSCSSAVPVQGTNHHGAAGGKDDEQQRGQRRRILQCERRPVVPRGGPPSCRSQHQGNQCRACETRLRSIISSPLSQV